jgi:hypothetical protein
LAGLIPADLFAIRPQPEQIARVRLVHVSERRVVMPTPPPPPPPLSHARNVAPAQVRTIARTVSGRSAPQRALHRAGAARPKPPALAHTKPIWESLPAGAQAAGAGARSGAGSLGSAGVAGGAATSGNGSGAAAGNEPCGFVEFSDPHGSRYDPRTGGFWVDIRMSVHFPDGRTESTMLDYPWYYPNEASNPWSDQNLNDPNFPTRFQTPPPDKRAGEPPLVQYVIEHSTPQGFTLLRDCPAGTPSPAAEQSP